MKNFIWSEFGVLDHWSLMDDGTLFIYNDQNQFRKMSPKYGLTIKKIIEKSDALKGYNVQIRTSQNTGQYSILEWFSDLSLSDTEVRIQEDSVTNVEPYSELNKKIEAMKKEIDEQKRLVEHEQEEKEKLSQRLIKASDKAEDYQAKNTELMEKYIQLQNYYNELTRTEQDEVDNVAHELIEMELVGTKKDVQCKGHPVKLFALRLGINREHRGRLNIEIKKHIKSNCYQVLLLDHGNREVQIALGIDRKTLHIRTVFSDIPKFSESLLSICGFNEELIKQSADTYALNDLVAMYQKVKGQTDNSILET